MRPKSIRNSMTNRSTNHVFLKQFFGPPFFIFCCFFSKMVDLGTPFEIRWGQKWHQNPPSSAKDSKTIVFFTTDSWPVLASAFHETTVILVPFGPSVLKNIIFSMMIGYFSVFSVFRCAMFYMSILSHLLKKPQ